MNTMGSSRNVLTVNRLLQNFRHLHCSRMKGLAYEGSGKTTATIINCETGPRILINRCLPVCSCKGCSNQIDSKMYLSYLSYSDSNEIVDIVYKFPFESTLPMSICKARTILQIGFVLNNNAAFIGPLAIFPKTMLCWNVQSAKDINRETLTLFLTVEPKPDILILGLETTYEHKRILDIKNILKDRRINVEILPVHRACGVFNFLCDEGRYVAAGLIPPLPEEVTQYKMLRENMQTIRSQRTLGVE